MSGRATFGPPRNAFGAFGWAALQLPRAFLWQVRERELRGLAFVPALLTFGLGAIGCVLALLSAGPLQELIFDRAPGLFGAATWLAIRVGLSAVLVVGALLTAWQLQGAIASAALERMALHVQRVVLGDAPAPAIDAPAVVKRAVVGLFPSVRRLTLWALSSLAAMTLILVPVVGAALVVIVQTTLGALFLAHGAITDNRDRLGLPRRLLLKEPALLLGYALACVPLVLFPPALLLGYALACVPLVLFPPALLFVAGPVSIGGAMVAVGQTRRSALP